MAIVRTCGLFVINDEDGVVCLHPTHHAIDFWSIPKGVLDEGETELEAAIRETYEECNINFDINNLVVRELTPQRYKHGKKKLCSFAVLQRDNPDIDFSEFKLRCNSNVPKERGNFPEVDAFGWVPIKKAKLFLHYPQVLALKELYMDKLLQPIKFCGSFVE